MVDGIQEEAVREETTPELATINRNILVHLNCHVVLYKNIIHYRKIQYIIFRKLINSQNEMIDFQPGINSIFD